MGSPITSPVTAPITFNGTSTYASSLQQVINKAVSLASLPLQQLENDEQTTAAKIDAAQSLQAQLSGLSNSLQALSSANGSTLTANVSDQTVASATASVGALPGTYTIQVTDPGSSTVAESSNSIPTVTDPNSQSISSSSSFTLTTASGTFTITPSSNNLTSLAQAINSSGAGVQATIINVGPPSAPDYRLVLQSTSLGNGSIQLNDGPSGLLTTLTTGTSAVYTVNGQPSGGITTNSSTVTIAPGVSVNILGAGTTTVTVGESASSISTALQNFVTSFNNAQAELQKSYGSNAGALLGDSSVRASSQALNALVGYSGSSNSTVQSLADLGIEFTQQGTLTFDPSKLNAMSPTQLSDAVGFLGDGVTSGFLLSATNTLNGLIDPTTGLLSGEISDLKTQQTSQENNIASQQVQITDLQNQLTQQMNAADALIASLQSQTNFLSQLFQTTNSNNSAGI